MDNHIKVDNQQTFDPVTKNLGMLQELQDLPIIAQMQNTQEINKAYIHCMQNCAVRKDFYIKSTKPNLINMADFLHGFWNLVECKLILLSNFVFAGKNYYEHLIDEAHVATAHGGDENTMQYPIHRYQ